MVRGLIPRAALRLPWAILYRAFSPNRMALSTRASRDLYQEF